jgi:predicted transport protein|tara:strand:- start:14462 stop:16549 length:2088 start_codon:yes stop_codon:yes gene_type:complete
MNAVQRFFPKIINGASQFIIPVFQRDYSWSEENCRQLWADLLAIADAGPDRGHFIGSVVYIQTGDSSAGFTRWLLIDGQQRVTTLTLLLTALRDHIRETGWQGSDDGPTVKRIDAYFLRNLQEEGEREIKLKLRRHDDATLQALISRQVEPANPSARIRDNYDLFRELLEDADPERVYRGLNRLLLVDVTLDRGIDDPQLIFESLNSTGVDLSPSDLIRNFILMRLPEKEQTRLYETYWSRIEELFRGSERVFDNFIRDYLALRSHSTKLERSDRVYDAFRRTFAGIGEDVEALEQLLIELLRRGRQYAAFAVGGGNDERARAFASLRRLGDVPAILIMRLLEAHETSGSLTEAELIEAVNLLESYLLRRAVIGAQTRGYGLEFAKLAQRIDENRPLASLKASLARMPGSYVFPSDDHFRSALEEADIYQKRVCFHLLEALENRGSKEVSDTSKYTIEHVMPQNEKLAEAWREMLGSNWQQIQKTWLHRLGNLTLTGYNSTYSDRPFEEKKTIKGGFEQSSVRLNQDIRDESRWTQEEMKVRGKRLASRALKIWPPLEADEAVIRAMEIEELKAKARRRNISQVQMSSDAANLFETLRAQLHAAFPDVIEAVERKSISYHDPEFFLEVIPRKRGLLLVVDLDFNEVDAEDDLAEDASDRSFVMHASHQGGVLVHLRSTEQIDRALAIVAQAHALT